MPVPMQRSINDSTLGLALGGGGMKGWAHLGVIGVLDEVGLKPNVISGCSAGALIGAYYAYGFSFDEMIRFMAEQRTTNLFSLRFDGLGLFGSDLFRDYLEAHFGGATFEDCRIPFFVTATDIETGREVVLSQGRLVDAILASSAMPGIFAPVEIGGRLLVDGGLCNNVPVSVLVAKGARYTIAVRLHQDASGLNVPPIRKTVPNEDATWRSIAGWTDRLARSIRGENLSIPNGMEVLGRAMEIVVSQIEGYRLQAYPPDILISPHVSHVGSLRFNGDKSEIFARGESAAREQRGALEKLKTLLTLPADVE